MKPYLAAENDPAELRRREAQDRVAGPLRELAANMMRVARGAGNPQDIGRQCVEVVDAYKQYRDLTGEWPDSGSLHTILSVENEVPDRLSADGQAWKAGENEIVRGALQIAASRLLGQRTQEAAGWREALDGWEPIEAQRARNARLSERAARATPKPRRSRDVKL